LSILIATKTAAAGHQNASELPVCQPKQKGFVFLRETKQATCCRLGLTSNFWWNPKLQTGRAAHAGHTGPSVAAQLHTSHTHAK